MTITLGNCGDRPRPVGFDVTDWRGGSAAHDPGFGAVKLDRQRGFGDRDREGLSGMDARRATFCPQITITPVALERRCGLRDELTVSRAEATAGKR